MTIDEIIEALADHRSLADYDPERAHARADESLLEALRESGQGAVVDAYLEVVSAASYWATS